MSDPDDHPVMIIDCENRTARLTEWDREFVASVKARVGGGRELTPKQTEKLDEIWERVTTRGTVRG